jgi:tetratricopeptide (TPR) repeat protein
MRFRQLIFSFLALAVLNASDASAGPREEAEALNKEAGKLHLDKKFPEAIKLGEKASAIIEESLGPDHPDLGRSLFDLARSHIPLGKFPEAERLLLRSIAILEKSLGSDQPKHRFIRLPIYQLAHLYQTQGRLAEAEPLLKRHIEVSEKAFGPDHSEVGSALRSLANLYRGQEDRKTEFKALEKRYLAIEEKEKAERDKAKAERAKKAQ